MERVPVHNSLGRAASNRPNTGWVGWPAVISGCSAKWRCKVRSPGAQPIWARRIRRTCAAVRSGFSRLSAIAVSMTSTGNRGLDWRGLGTSASNPPARQARIQRSSVSRETRTSRPDGSRCSLAAIWRTSRPRALGDSCGSAASRINCYRNSPIARALARCPGLADLCRRRPAAWCGSTHCRLEGRSPDVFEENTVSR